MQFRIARSCSIFSFHRFHQSVCALWSVFFFLLSFHLQLMNWRINPKCYKPLTILSNKNKTTNLSSSLLACEIENRTWIKRSSRRQKREWKRAKTTSTSTAATHWKREYVYIYTYRQNDVLKIKLIGFCSLSLYNNNDNSDEDDDDDANDSDR